MKRLLLLALVVLWSIPQWAASAVLTTNGSSCPGTTNTTAIVVNLPEDKGGATLTVAGTWTGTISFYGTGSGGINGGGIWTALSVLPIGSSTAVTSTTANGTWQVNVAGFTGVCMLSSASMTGSATVTITPSAASARSNGGSSSGGSGNANYTGTQNVLAKGSGTAHTLIDSSITDNGTTIAATESISTTGGVTTGVGGTTAGFYDFINGTAHTPTANSFSMFAPATITTAFGWSMPAAENGSAGVLHLAAASSHVSAATVSAVALADVATQVHDTEVANVTSGTAAPTAAPLPAGGTNGCSGATDIPTYTAGTGWGCTQRSSGPATTIVNHSWTSSTSGSQFQTPIDLITSPTTGTYNISCRITQTTLETAPRLGRRCHIAPV